MRQLVLPATLLLGLAAPLAARAGVYSDDLSRCLVAHTQESDQIVMAQWIFGIMAAHPDVAAVAKVDAAARTETSKKMARIFQSLLTEACRDETAKAVKYEGTEALKGSFKVLGEIAMQTLMTNPKVAAQSQVFAQYLDKDKLKAVVEPAPAAPPAPPAPPPPPAAPTASGATP